jgi:hypothetical protein
VSPTWWHATSGPAARTPTAEGDHAFVKTWLRNHGLLLANLGLFVAFFAGMIISGVRVYNDNQLEHGQSPVALTQYLATGDFVEATFENWESEFLQMGMYVVLTAYLFQKGSSESKPVSGGAPQDEDPRTARLKPGVPWPVRRGGWVLRVYEHSLSALFFVLFAGSVIGHALGGAKAYSDEELMHGGQPVSFWQYFGTSQFWFESMQNWQSEFLAIAIMVGASVYLRERGSAESKPVAKPHAETGS